jgi:hypothetical protein
MLVLMLDASQCVVHTAMAAGPPRLPRALRFGLHHSHPFFRTAGGTETDDIGSASQPAFTRYSNPTVPIWSRSRVGREHGRYSLACSVCMEAFEEARIPLVR